MDKNAIRKRAENWTKDEEMALVDAITPFYDELFGKLNPNLTNTRKTTIWASISATVINIMFQNLIKKYNNINHFLVLILKNMLFIL